MSHLPSAHQSGSSPAPTPSGYAAFMSVTGYILAVSYPVLALSTGVRALYQLFFKGEVDYLLPPVLSLVAALLYLVAAIGFAWRRRWTWWLSLIALSLEALMTLLIGTLSFTQPDLIGHTVWRHYGADYGYFPLVQPFIGLLWLLWPATRTLFDGHYPIAPAPHSTSQET